MMVTSHQTASLCKLQARGELANTNLSLSSNMDFTSYSWLLALLFVCISASPVPEMENHTNQPPYTVRVVSSKPPISEKRCIIGPPHYGYLTECDCSCNHTTTSSPTHLWRIVCPNLYHLFTIMMELSIGPHSYLQVKNRQFSGKMDGSEFLSFMFNKKSILVGLVSNDVVPASFLMGYVCVARDSRPLADSIFSNPGVLQYLALNSNNGAFLNISRVLYDPGEILNASDDWINILDIINNTSAPTESEGPGSSSTSSGESHS